MAADRTEQSIETVEKSNSVADLGDLTQLMSRGQEAKGETSITQIADALYDMTKSFGKAVYTLAQTEAGSRLIDTIEYMAEKGEPLYMILRDQLRK